MNRPKRVRVGTFDYKIEYEKLLSEVPASGMTSSGTTTFYLNPNQDKQQLRDTLIHEVLHGLWKQTSLLVRFPDEDPDSPGELIIQDLSALLYAFIRDNREVVEWLQKA